MAVWHFLVLYGALIVRGGDSGINATVQALNRLQPSEHVHFGSNESDELLNRTFSVWNQKHNETNHNYRQNLTDSDEDIEYTQYPHNFYFYYKYCEPENFTHFYIVRGGHREPMNNTWKKTLFGERGGLHEVCLMPNGMPLTRACNASGATFMDPQLGRQFKPRWENITHWNTIECLRQTREHIISDKLNTLHDQIIEGKRLNRGKQGRREVMRLMHDILREPDYKLLPADVHFTSNILKKVAAEAQDQELSSDFVDICNTFMSSDPQVLRVSASLNATNAMLDVFETYMDGLSQSMVPQGRCSIQPVNLTNDSIGQMNTSSVEVIDFSELGVRGYSTGNLSVFYMNPGCANVTGIALYDPNTPNRYGRLSKAARSDFLYRFVYLNESTLSVMQESGLQAATFLPASLWQHVRRTLEARFKLPLIVFKIYAHDALFVDQNSVLTCKPISMIISISIPGYKDKFPEVLPFILRAGHVPTTSDATNIIGSRCGYWNYNTWVYDGVESDTPSPSQLLQAESTILLCGTNHLTQFSYLLGGSFKQTDPSGNVLITPVHAQALDIISLVGCSLSLMGLLGIWLTALLFKSWRTLFATKILLNMCLALTFQMVLFVFVNTDDMSQYLIEEGVYGNCVALGALMQYSILVLFSWMLIVAFLQYQRYVTIVGVQRPPHYVLRSAIAAWGFPLIPTLLVVFIDPESYIPTAYQLRTDTGVCYPSGYGLMFGVFLPVTLVVIANLTIVIYVFYSISHSLSQSMHRHEKQMIFRQIRLSVLLFFLLGLSWIFGIFAFMKAGVVFSYLFCLTATLQGFVIFVFFVVLSDVTQNAWLDLLCPARRQKSKTTTTELQSMNTASTGLENGAEHR